ncbi:hypothetical protein [Flavobacterium sharifuzzamanii]|uniref:hypothetical protein n=1 Tax=Flavobacterium sharifuzzamanii TaxID=2211133 RepID=UPI000DAB4572|nr:hypothetical protein [Flavobacterium sharifuzzamanii]KAF2082237.1 hypothetical protein DMA14_04525 [Flavobacterium sharifuzzamanii]
MIIIRKIAGFALIILAGLLSVGTLLNFISAVLLKSPKEFQTSFSTGAAYLFAAILFTFLLVVLIRFMFKLGLKLLGKKQINNDSIEEIGRNKI